MKDEIKKQIPFSTYDFLGYLIPGGTFIATGHFFDKWLTSATPKTTLTLEFSNFAKVVQDVNSGGDANAFNSVMAIVLVFVVCYTVGHIIATLSSFFIDRYLIKSGFRYPLINFLNKDKNNDIVTPQRIFKTRARFVLFLAYLFTIMALQMTLINYQLSLFDFIWYLVGSTIVLFIGFFYIFPRKLIAILSYFPNKLGIVINDHLDMSGRMEGYFAKRVIEFIKKDFGIDLNRSKHSKSYCF